MKPYLFTIPLLLLFVESYSQNDFRKVKWLMSKDEIFKSEPDAKWDVGELLRAVGPAYDFQDLWFEKNINGHPATVKYRVIENQLVSAQYKWALPYAMTNNDFENSIIDTINNKYTNAKNPTELEWVTARTHIRAYRALVVPKLQKPGDPAYMFDVEYQWVGLGDFIEKIMEKEREKLKDDF